MPILDPHKKTVPPTTGKALPVEMRSAVVETRFNPVQDLITNISGARLVIDCYSQLLGSSDHPRALDIELPPAQQQYNRIQNMEVRQQGDLSQSLDESTNEFTVTGEFITYAGFYVPNVGDMYVMDVGQGEWGIAAATQASPLTIYKQTCYRVQFRVLYRMDSMRLKNLQDKVVDQMHFVMDFLRAGKNPVIVDQEHDRYRRLDRLHSAMVADYVRSFFSDVNKTLIIPGQDGGAYDPFLVKAVLSLLQVTDHPLMGELSRHAVDVQYAYKTTTIWDALLQVEPSYLYLATQRVGLVTKNLIRDRSVFGGAYWHQFKQVMFPLDSRIDADTQFTRVMLPTEKKLEDGGAPLTDIERLIINTADSVNMAIVDEYSSPEEPPMIPVVNQDLFYVFTEAFYKKDTANMSQLELFVWSVLDHNEIDVEKLYAFVDMSRRWDRLERFYYVPVLIWLCVIAFRGPSHA